MAKRKNGSTRQERQHMPRPIVTRHSTASSFLEETNDLLTRSEAENTLMISLAVELARSEVEQIEGPYSSAGPSS